MLRKIDGKWALVSKSNPDKVLRWYRGPADKKPSKEWIEREERRIQYFKNKGKKS